MVDLVPNPLVTDVAKGLFERGVTTLQQSVAAFDAAETAVSADNATAQDEAKFGTEADRLATRLAEEPRLPELIMFAGYIGGRIDLRLGGQSTRWRLLYLDGKLLTWLLVMETDIVHRRSSIGVGPRSDLRDVLWIKADASVSRGTGQPRLDEMQASYLRGDFTRAGDFATTLSGGTGSPQTGFLCEARTPGCCGIKTR
jgi:hypothetical protein